jgi:hypothetical protein
MAGERRLDRLGRPGRDGRRAVEFSGELADDSAGGLLCGASGSNLGLFIVNRVRGQLDTSEPSAGNSSTGATEAIANEARREPWSLAAGDLGTRGALGSTRSHAVGVRIDTLARD